MFDIIVTKPTKEELASWNINSWSSWECEPSTFDWTYLDHESAYVFEGHVIVEAYGKKTEIKKGDLVHFPKGMSCVWNVKETIKKVYNFNHKNIPFNK